MNESTVTPTSVVDSLERLPDRAEAFIRRRRHVIERFTQVGWLAKGIVYVLFGVTGVAVAMQSSPNDEASPKGALSRVNDLPGGRLLLALIAIGLLLYSLWRLGSALLVTGGEAQDWGDRVGYTFSAGFYLLLGFTALQSALRGSEPDSGQSTVESVSRSLMEPGFGRWLVGLGGIATIAVAGYFIVRKGVMRSFADDLEGVAADGSENDGIDHTIWAAGIIGWIGRGVATALVGFFVARAAVQFDPDDAKGFDQALRQAADSSVGSALVWVAAVGLTAYGVFCLISHRRRKLGDAA